MMTEKRKNEQTNHQYHDQMIKINHIIYMLNNQSRKRRKYKIGMIR